MARPHAEVFSHVTESNIPKHEKIAIMKLLGQVMPTASGAGGEVEQGSVFEDLTVGNIESFVTGGLIGAAAGPDDSILPALVAMVGGGLASGLAPGPGSKKHFSRVMHSGSSCLGFQSVRKVLYEKKLAAHGESSTPSSSSRSGRDPVEMAGEGIDDVEDG